MVRRLIIGYLVVTVFVLVVLEVPLAMFYQQREVENVSVLLERDASAIGSFYEDALEAGDEIDPQRAIDYAAASGTRVLIVDVDGISLADTSPDFEIERDYSTRPEIATALEGGKPSGTRDSTTLQSSIIYAAVPVASGGTVHGAVRLTLDGDEIGERVLRFWLGLAAIALLVLGASILLGWAVARSVSRPIRQLEHDARRFADGDLTPTPAPVDAPAEVEHLHTAMVHMATQLAGLLEKQRGFVGDASHQLRTPITGLMLRLEAIADGVEDPRAEAEAALVETQRLAQLVTSLLRLARADEPSQLVSVDPVRLAKERVDVWQAVADQNGVRLEVTGAGPGMVALPSGALEQILDNLIDNALDYAETPGPGPRASIEVDVAAKDGLLAVSVIDHGGGMSDTDKELGTQRFWRGRTGGAGSGLGLAIAESLAVEGGGGISLTDTPGGGLTVRITMATSDGDERDGPGRSAARRPRV